MGLATNLFRKIVKNAYQEAPWGDVYSGMAKSEKENLLNFLGGIRKEVQDLYRPGNTDVALDYWKSKGIYTQKQIDDFRTKGTLLPRPGTTSRYPQSFHDTNGTISFGQDIYNSPAVARHELAHEELRAGLRQNPIIENLSRDMRTGGFLFRNPSGGTAMAGSINDWEEMYRNLTKGYTSRYMVSNPGWKFDQLRPHIMKKVTGEVDAMLAEGAIWDKLGRLSEGIAEPKYGKRIAYYATMPQKLRDYYKSIAGMVAVPSAAGLGAMNRDKPFYEQEIENAP